MKEKHLRQFGVGLKDSSYYSSGSKVFCKGQMISRADLATFRFYDNGFAKDSRTCYCMGHGLKGSDPSSFVVLNYCYVRDNCNVWTLGGKLENVDSLSFEVCDDGYRTLSDGKCVPCGYGKDKNTVYFFDFSGKPKQVRNARVDSFVSLVKGAFGKDDRAVYFGSSKLTGVASKEWVYLSGAYSKSESKVYHRNRQMKQADASTFKVDPNVFTLARDQHRFYRLDQEISERQYDLLRSKLATLTRGK